MSNHIEPFLEGSTYNDVTEESVTSTYTVTPSQTEDTCIERLTKQKKEWKTSQNGVSIPYSEFIPSEKQTDYHPINFLRRYSNCA